MIKTFPLSLLLVGFSVGFFAFSQEKTACQEPEPFIKLDTVAAKKVPLAAILAATRSVNASQVKQNTKTVLTQSITSKVDVANKIQQIHLVNFWAAWCSPCRQELPFLDSLSEKGMAKVSIINVGDELESAQKILNELSIKHSLQYRADGEILSNFGIQGLPASIVYASKHVFLGVGKLKEEKLISEWLQCLSKTDKINK